MSYPEMYPFGSISLDGRVNKSEVYYAYIPDSIDPLKVDLPKKEIPIIPRIVRNDHRFLVLPYSESPLQFPVNGHSLTYSQDDSFFELDIWPETNIDAFDFKNASTQQKIALANLVYYNFPRIIVDNTSTDNPYQFEARRDETIMELRDTGKSYEFSYSGYGQDVGLYEYAIEVKGSLQKPTRTVARELSEIIHGIKDRSNYQNPTSRAFENLFHSEMRIEKI